MSFRGRVLGLVEVVLRVPPLFVIDEILKIGLSITELSEHDLSNFGEEEYQKVAKTYSNVTTISIPYDPLLYKFILMSVMRLLFSAVGCISAICLFVLSTKHLMVVYMYLTSVGLVFLSYWSNLSTVKLLAASIENSNDARRETFWEKLDDYIYYIRAFGNTVEFCFGIFLFFNGAWILMFESGSAIRAVMMCIHAYFNIWCDAKAGWSVFMKRRTAVKKIESLPEADKDQLRALDDVCAICYQEMQTAKITKCKHFFHGVCLRKWLYVQDRCPLCHEILHAIDAEERKENGEAPPVAVEENNYDR